MDNILEIKNLIVEYNNIKSSASKPIVAVNDVSLSIKKGEIYAIAGESGCGKSTLAKAITRLIIPKNGDILFEGKSITDLSGEDKKRFPLNIQMVFQNPYSSLNPKMTIGDILKEPLDINTNYSKTKKTNIIKEILNDVGLK
ncbi:ATP-binding cassette domain-containing protein, partial [bacterium]|nr:ATP-binding cassette domain-containing protein [bacterium]